MNKIFIYIFTLILFCTNAWTLSIPSQVHLKSWQSLLFQEDGRARKDIPAQSFEKALKLCKFKPQHRKGSHTTYQDPQGRVFVLPTVHGKLVKPIYAIKLRELMTTNTNQVPKDLGQYLQKKLAALAIQTEKEEKRQAKIEQKKARRIDKQDKRSKKKQEQLELNESDSQPQEPEHSSSSSEHEHEQSPQEPLLSLEEEGNFWLAIYKDYLELEDLHEYEGLKAIDRTEPLALSIIKRIEQKGIEVPSELNDVYYILLRIHTQKFANLKTEELKNKFPTFLEKQLEWIEQIHKLDPKALDRKILKLSYLTKFAITRLTHLGRTLLRDLSDASRNKDPLSQNLENITRELRFLEKLHKDAQALQVSKKLWEQFINQHGKLPGSQNFSAEQTSPTGVIETVLAIAHWVYMIYPPDANQRFKHYQQGLQLLNKASLNQRTPQDVLQTYPIEGLLEKIWNEHTSYFENWVQERQKEQRLKSFDTLKQTVEQILEPIFKIGTILKAYKPQPRQDERLIHQIHELIETIVHHLESSSEQQTEPWILWSIDLIEQWDSLNIPFPENPSLTENHHNLLEMMRFKLEEIISQNLTKAVNGTLRPNKKKKLLEHTAELVQKAKYFATETLEEFSKISYDISHGSVYQSLGMLYKDNFSSESNAQKKAMYYLWQSFQIQRLHINKTSEQEMLQKQLTKNKDFCRRTAREFAATLIANKPAQWTEIPKSEKQLLGLYLLQHANKPEWSSDGIITLLSSESLQKILKPMVQTFEEFIPQDIIVRSA